MAGITHRFSLRLADFRPQTATYGLCVGSGNIFFAVLQGSYALGGKISQQDRAGVLVRAILRDESKGQQTGFGQECAGLTDVRPASGVPLQAGVEQSSYIFFGQGDRITTTARVLQGRGHQRVDVRVFDSQFRQIGWNPQRGI